MSPATDDPLVTMEGVWRRYRQASAEDATSLRGLLAKGGRGWRRPWFWALQDVSLEVRRGEAVALVGRNGAGKSTLLRLIGGVGRPDRGVLHAHGRVGALLDLGREFHLDLTGRQNAEMAAIVAGLTRRQFHQRFDEIVGFADLQQFVDEPIRAYSDGMRARLAFSVVAHVDPELLLVDEALAVGDAPFQRRSVERIEMLRDAGTAIVFVTHDLSLARHVCDTGMWLHHGEIRARGPVVDVVEEYLADTVVHEPVALSPAGGSSITNVAVLDAWGAPTRELSTGEGLVVEAAISPDDRPRRLSVKMRLAGSPLVVVDTSTAVRPGDATTYRVRFLRLDVTPGAVEIDVGLYSDDWSVEHDVRTSTIRFTGEGPDTAPLAPPHEWTRNDLWRGQ